MLGVILVTTMLLSARDQQRRRRDPDGAYRDQGRAENMGASIDPFLMAVAIGGSAAFLSPIGHQSNTIVMGPGGYRFADYLIMGLPPGGRNSCRLHPCDHVGMGRMGI